MEVNNSMPKSPVISKIRVNNPNKKSSRVQNRNHLVYIGTRDGVDLTETLWEPDEEASNELYLKYIHERPRSNGLFGNVDVSDIIKLSNHVADETAKGKCIYRGIISLVEEDAVRLGYNEKSNWENLVNRVMPDIAKEFGIPITRLNYCAAVHMEQSHPHCHYMFWDEKDKVTTPFIHTAKQNKIREMISGVINEEEIQQQILNKTLQRDLILDLNKDLLNEELDTIINSQDKIAGRIKSDDIDNIATKILLLSNNLPEKGRILYKFLPPDTKNQVDELVEDILKIPTMKKEYEQYVSTINDISKAYSTSNSHKSYTEDKNIKDIKKRLANQILKTCTNVRSIPYSIEFDAEPKEEIINSDVNEEVDIDYKANWSKEYKKAIKDLYNPKNKDIENILKILHNEAKNGNVLAMNDLGKIYSKGIKVEKNKEFANEYYKAAFKGFAYLAQTSDDRKQYYNYRLGKMYESGIGTSKDYKKAILCYKAASDNKYAQYSLASLYLKHKGIDVNSDNELTYYTEALKLLKRSAEAENMFSSYMLSKNSENRNVLNLSKEYIDKQYMIAANGFKNSVKDVENDFLLYRLGTMYYEGKGVEKDDKIAFEYFQRSAEMNNANALYAMGKFYADKNMDLYNPVEAEQYFQSSIKEGNDYAKYSLALLYLDKESPLYDMKKGVDLLEVAAEQGNDSAKYQLGKIYTNKESDFYDLYKGIKFLSQASDSGNMNAKYQLGKIYTDKESGCYDITKGLDYLKVAAENGNSYATAKLGSMYLWGKHAPDLPKDTALGLQYLNKAVEMGNPYAKDMINFYDNYRNSMMQSLSYSMLQSMYKIVSQTGQVPRSEESLKKYARQSKEYKKVQAKLQKHGRDM